MAAVERAPGCYKCGKTGHWASQCTVPPDQWIPQSSRPQPAGAAGTQGGTQQRSTQQGGGSQTQQERRATQQPQGCFKCGKTGHWSRDCTAPQDQWVPRDGPRNGGAAGGTDENDVPLLGAAPAAGVKRKAARKKRPKVTVEDLQKDSGFKQLVEVFPTQFRAIFKGPGHEAGDLRRLLDMYERWHRAVAPALPYDTFLEDLEKMGQTHALKVELRGLRDGVMKEAEPEPEAPLAAAAPDREDAAAGTTITADGDADDDWGGGDDMDDDELVALQAEEWEQAAPEEMFEDLVSGAPADDVMDVDGRGAAPATTPSQDALDDELLSLAEMEEEDDAAPAAAPQSATQEALDDELLALAELEDDEDPGTAAGDAGAAAPQTASQEALDDELLALAEMEDDDGAAPTDSATAAAAPQSATQEALEDELLALAALESDDDAAPADAAGAAAASAVPPSEEAAAPSTAEGGTEAQTAAPLAPQADTQLDTPDMDMPPAPAGADAAHGSAPVPSSSGGAATIGGTAATGGAAAAAQGDDEDDLLLEAALALEATKRAGGQSSRPTAAAGRSDAAGRDGGGGRSGGSGGGQGAAGGTQLPEGVDVADMDDDQLLELAMMS